MGEQRFRVGLTRDFLNQDGDPTFGDIGLDMLKRKGQMDVEFLDDTGNEITAAAARDFDALLVLTPRVTRATLEGSDRLALVARFGVGYDNVDVDACSEHDVILSITPDGVRRPVAASALALLLALSHRLLQKDRMTREGRWHDKLDYMGIGLTDRTLGLVGLGNIGKEIFHVAAPLEMRHVACDPHVSKADAAAMNVELLSLEELLSQSDFVCVCCALTPETHQLLNQARLELMSPNAFLINVARGPVVDQAALTKLLQQKRIAGAALDVFEREPIDPADPLLKLDNVILAPHAICWTDEMFRGNGRSACQSILDVASGRAPRHVVNRAVLERPSMTAKLNRYADTA